MHVTQASSKMDYSQPVLPQSLIPFERSSLQLHGMVGMVELDCFQCDVCYILVGWVHYCFTSHVVTFYDTIQEDKPWHWDHLLTELQSDLQEHVKDMT